MTSSAIRSSGRHIYQHFAQQMQNNARQLSTVCGPVQSTVKTSGSGSRRLLRQSGKWAQVEGYDRPLLSFAGNDTFALKECPDLLKTEQDALQLTEIIRRATEADLKTLVKALASSQSSTALNLSITYGKEETVVTGLDFNVLLSNVIMALTIQGFQLLAIKNLHLSPGCVPASVRVLESVAELEASLKLQMNNSKSFIIFELDATDSNLDDLRRVKCLSEQHKTKILLVDPDGAVLIRQAICDLKENLELFRSSELVLGSTTALGDDNPLTYAVGSQNLINSLDCSLCGVPVTVEHYAHLQKTKKALERLHLHSGMAYKTILNRQAFVRELSKSRCVPYDARKLAVSLNPNFIGVDPEFLSDYMSEMGIYLPVTEGHEGLSVSFTPYLELKDVQLLHHHIQGCLRRVPYSESAVDVSLDWTYVQEIQAL